MITLLVLIILVLIIIFLALLYIGGAIIVLIDPIIAILIIWLGCKLAKRIKNH